MQKQWLKTNEFAKAIGVHKSTVIRWEREGILKPERRTPTGHRLYNVEQVNQMITK